MKLISGMAWFILLITGLMTLILSALHLVVAAVGVVDDRVLSLSAVIQELQRKERLDEDRAIYLRDIESNDLILRGLIDGRLPLWEAMEAMRAQKANRPAHLRPCYDSLPGRSSEERHQRGIILVVRSYLAQDSRLPGVVERLEAQLQAYVEGRMERSSGH
jgi:heme exporter protein D